MSTELTQEELAMFNGPPPGADFDDPFADLDGQIPDSKLIPTGTPKNDPGLPPPPKSKRSIIMPACAACGVDLNPDNASQLRDGTFKHVGCLVADRVARIAESSTAAPAPAVTTSTPAPKARKPRATVPIVAADPDPGVERDPEPQEPGKPDLQAPMKLVTSGLVLEFGPKTLATLEALVAALSR